MNIKKAIEDISSTEDLLERALKLSGLEDTSMDWVEVERLADMNDFKVLLELKRLKAETGLRTSWEPRAPRHSHRRLLTA